MKNVTEASASDPGRARPLDVEQLVEEHHARIFAYLRRRCGGEAVASELTQQTFVRAWGALDRFEGRSSVNSWLHGVAHHVWLDWCRSSGRFETRPETWWEQLPAAESTPAESLIRADSAGVVYAAVEKLEGGMKDVIHLHYYQGLSLSETADALQIAISTVKYRIREAVGLLQSAVLDTHSHSLKST